MPHGRRVKRSVSHPPAPILRSFEVSFLERGSTISITRHRLYADGREEQQMVGSYADADQAMGVAAAIARAGG